jgi:hypothetical protein
LRIRGEEMASVCVNILAYYAPDFK